MNELIILVDEQDNEIGVSEKNLAHLNGGKLHRAFSIFIYNTKKQMLIQKRAINKYHSGGLWSNTCCSHPRVDEQLEIAIHRRLQEEMGFDCLLTEIFSFNYHADFENGLTEREIDHVFIGKYSGEINPNINELDDWMWIEFTELLQDVKNNPQNYTVWFKLSIEKVIEICKSNNNFKSNQTTKTQKINY